MTLQNQCCIIALQVTTLENIMKLGKQEMIKSPITQQFQVRISSEFYEFVQVIEEADTACFDEIEYIFEGEKYVDGVFLFNENTFVFVKDVNGAMYLGQISKDGMSVMFHGDGDLVNTVPIKTLKDETTHSIEGLQDVYIDMQEHFVINHTVERICNLEDHIPSHFEGDRIVEGQVVINSSCETVDPFIELPPPITMPDPIIEELPSIPEDSTPATVDNSNILKDRIAELESELAFERTKNIKLMEEMLVVSAEVARLTDPGADEGYTEAATHSDNDNVAATTPDNDGFLRMIIANQDKEIEGLKETITPKAKRVRRAELIKEAIIQGNDTPINIQRYLNNNGDTVKKGYIYSIIGRAIKHGDIKRITRGHYENC